MKYEKVANALMFKNENIITFSKIFERNFSQIKHFSYPLKIEEVEKNL